MFKVFFCFDSYPAKRAQYTAGKVMVMFYSQSQVATAVTPFSLQMFSVSAKERDLGRVIIHFHKVLSLS